MIKNIFKKELLLNYFKPTIYIKNINEIDFKLLKKIGIKIFICDLDNTLISFCSRKPNLDNLNLIKNVKKNGMIFVLLSNNKKKHVEEFVKNTDIKYYYWKAKKPLLKYFNIISKKFNINSNKMIMIGDKLITDILFANRVNMKSILVEPISKINKSNYLINFFEKIIYKKLIKKNILHKK